MKAVLIRVGADGTPGGGRWVAPLHFESRRFIYIPIPEKATKFHPGCERLFNEVADPLYSFLDEFGITQSYWSSRLTAKLGQPMHLDPDFEHLTYGDFGDRRGRILRTFERGDRIVFYAALKPIDGRSGLVYAVTGLMVVDEIVSAVSVKPEHRGQNAHTRKAVADVRDIVVRGEPSSSGRCMTCIPIGQKRDVSNYYLTPDVECAWGGLQKADGSPRKSSWLNMSGVLPLIGNPEGFVNWWNEQSVSLTRKNFAE